MAKKKSPTQAMFDDEQVEEKVESKKNVNQEPLPSGQNFLELPSKGLLGYPSTVTYRDILVKDEERLSTATGETYARTLNSVLKSILNDCKFFEQLSIFDRDYALVWLWANNYDHIKKVDVKCENPKCGHEEVKSVDLQNVDVNDVKTNIPVPFTIPMASGGTLNVRLNTVGDEIEVEDFLSYGENREKYAFDHLMMVASIITEFNIPFANKVQWVGENIRGKEMGLVRQFHQYFRYGVDDIIEHKCSECKEVTRGQLPFSASDVLFPTVSNNIEELLRLNEDSKVESK